MTFVTWWKLLSHLFKTNRRSPEAIARFRPRMETLEDRWVPSSTTLTPAPDGGQTGPAGSLVEFRKFDSSVTMQTLDQIEANFALDPSSPHVVAQAFDNGVPTINYVDTGGGNLFPNPRDVSSTGPGAFGGGFLADTTKGTFNGPGAEDDNFAMEARGVLFLPAAGDWTFFSRTDDGARLRLGADHQVVLSDNGYHPPYNYPVTVTVPQAGYYPYEFTWYQGWVGAEAELLAQGPGQSSPVLVGDVANGGLPVFETYTFPLYATAARVAATEGTAFSGTVAYVTDYDPTATTATVAATIDWGDGTRSAGTVTGGQAGFFAVAGSHTYAEEGAPVVTVTVTDTDDGASITRSAAASVAEADALAASAAPAVAATEGQSFAGTVAVFSDAGYPANTAGGFTASVDWGDGTADAGTVTSAGDGNFTVAGSHTYAEDGSHALTVTFQDADGTAAATATGTASVAEADLTGTVGFAPTEGTAYQGAVATFTDPGSTDPASAFAATIDWGDGTTDGGMVTSDGMGNYTVSGTHTYAGEGTQAVAVTLTESAAAPGFTATAAGGITVAEGDTLAAAAAQPAATVRENDGTSSVAVAVFTDAGNPGNDPNDFRATIDWGDGATTTGTVTTAGDGNFTVSGSHAYADEGSSTATVTLADADGTVSATAVNTVVAAEGDTLASWPAGTLSATEGTGFTGGVALFYDQADPNRVASDLRATIDWGDGISDAGTVHAIGMGEFTVTGSHTYADEGTFPVTVVLADADGTSAATATQTMIVADADADALTAGPVAFTATEGTAFSGAVASFTDAYAGSSAADFAATVDWGDGTTTPGTVTGAAGNFTVSGNHTYADEGARPVTVTLAEAPPGTASATASGTVLVAGGDVLTATGVPVTATEAAAAVGISVATFTDADAGTPAGDFSATIDWGDGTTTAGTVTGSAGQFTVTGSHRYAQEGTYAVQTAVAENAPGSAAATAVATATVQEVPVQVTSSGLLLSAGVDVGAILPGGLLVGTFTDPAGPELTGGQPTPGAYTVDIAWGDGMGDRGTITYDAASGTFQVHGDHVYATQGFYPVTVTVHHGGTDAAAVGIGNVADAPLFVTAYTPPAAGATSFNGPLAQFASYDLTLPLHPDASAFIAAIDWGDGTSSVGTVTAYTLDSAGHEEFVVDGAHTYAAPPTGPVSVTVYDRRGGAQTYYDGRTTTPQGTPKSAGTTLVWVYDARSNTYEAFYVAYG